jgi:hypothetical protein
VVVRIYCECCGCHQPLLIEEMRSDELNGQAIWGDLLCSICKLVIATLTVEEPGQYEFRKVRKT